MIKRTFTVRDKNIVLQLFKSLVRPHLEYSVQAWRPHFRKDIDQLEGVQRRATKLITSLKDKTYEDRLRLANLTTLETRKLRGDLIEVFKIFKGFDDLDPTMVFELSQAHTRGHSLKLTKPRCRLDIRKFSFAHRVLMFGTVQMRVLSHVTQLTVSKIELINVCTIEGSYKLLIELPSLISTEY